jgi:hypothetical protein
LILTANETDAALDQAVAVLQGGVERGDSEPAAVGRLLVTLGEQVGSVATSDIGTPVADRLSQLSALLTDGGNTLANR